MDLFLKFGLVAFWMGIRLLGGPGQTGFSTDLREAWLDVLTGQEKEIVKTTDTIGLSVMECLYSRSAKGDLKKLWGLDACYSHILSADYLSKLKKVTVRESMLPAMAIHYYRIMPTEERQPTNFSEEELSKGFNWVK